MSYVENQIIVEPDTVRPAIVRYRSEDSGEISDVIVFEEQGIRGLTTSGEVYYCKECEDKHITIVLSAEASLALARAMAPDGYAVVPLDDVITSAR